MVGAEGRRRDAGGETPEAEGRGGRTGGRAAPGSGRGAPEQPWVSLVRPWRDGATNLRHLRRCHTACNACCNGVNKKAQVATPQKTDAKQRENAYVEKRAVYFTLYEQIPHEQISSHTHGVQSSSRTLHAEEQGRSPLFSNRKDFAEDLAQMCGIHDLS